MLEVAAHGPGPPADPFPTVLAEHRPMLVGYLYRRTRDRDLAEDLAQDTMLRALRGLSSYRDQGAGPGPWLYTIAHHTHVNHRRRTARTVAVGAPTELPAALAPTSPGADEAAVAAVTGCHRRAVLDQAMRRLPDTQRAVLQLRFDRDLDLAETAAALGVTVASVKALQYRAARELARDPAVQALRWPPGEGEPDRVGQS